MFVFEKQRTVLFFYRVNYPPPRNLQVFSSKIFIPQNPISKNAPNKEFDCRARAIASRKKGGHHSSAKCACWETGKNQS